MFIIRHPVKYYSWHWINNTIQLRISLRIKFNISWKILFKNYCLNIIVNINSSIALKISVNTNLKYCYSPALNETLKLRIGAMKFFSKKLLDHEMFSS